MVAKRKPPAKRFPCIFAGLDIKPADDHIQLAWQKRHGKGAPFGSLRQTWRRSHCATINPYGSEACPYTRAQCIAAYEAAVMASLAPNVIDSRVYFISVARTTGWQRAETKPQTRITEAVGPGLVGAVGQGRQEGRSSYLASPEPEDREPRLDDLRHLHVTERGYLRRRASKPTRIGEMLRRTDGGAREGRPDDGSEGSQ